RVFFNLFLRAQEAKKYIVLHVEDIEEPCEDEPKEAATLSRKLLDLFPESGMLNITTNEEAESVLSDLANCFGKTISDKNILVA
ncbi:hypothetical protein BGZ76_006888, partial [Entomortierella beljakovae]